MMDQSSLLMGMAFGLGIISIPSPKDMFFIEMCVMKRSVLPLTLIAVVSDGILILIGLTIFSMTGESVAIDLVIKVLAALYIVYLFFSMDADLLSRKIGQSSSGKMALMRMGELSLVNPYSWIDTVVFMGGMAAVSHYPGDFILGAVAASALWFAALALIFGWLLPQTLRNQVYRYMPLCSRIILLLILVILVLDIRAAILRI